MMAACKDCICFGICKRGFPWADGKGGGWCEDFKDKSTFIEVPCKIGQTAWIIRNFKGTIRPYAGTIDALNINKDMQLIVNVKYLGCGLWGEKVFPSEAAALEAIKGKTK